MVSTSVCACGSEPEGPATTAGDASIDAGSADAAGAGTGVADAGSLDSAPELDTLAADSVGVSDGAGSATDVSGAAQIDATEPDAGPQDVFAAKPGLPMKAIVAKVHARPWTFDAPVEGNVSLSANTKGEANLMGPLDGQVDPFGETAKQPSAVVRYGGMTYLADAIGQHGLLTAKLKLLPLAAALPKKSITALYTCG